MKHISQIVIGIGEIAEMAHTSTSNVANWRKRHDDFPKPIVELAMGPVFDRGEMKLWLERNGKLNADA